MGFNDEVQSWITNNWNLDLTLREWWQRLADSGYAFPAWPKNFGGLGSTVSQTREIHRLLGEAGTIGAPTGIAPNMGAATIFSHGNDEQRERFIPGVANGTELWCQLFSEPGAGSDLASLGTRAIRDGDEFIVTGQKVWNSSAESAEWGMLLARTDVDRPKHQGISWMLIDMKQPGIEARPLLQMNGSAEFCEVFLNEARVPIANVIGAVNDGWNIARTTLTHERSSIGQQYARGLTEIKAGGQSTNLDRRVGELIDSAKKASRDPNKRFDIMVGAKSMIRLFKDLGLSEDRVARDKVVSYYIRSEVHRLTGQRSRDNAKGGKPGPEGSIVKLSTALLAHISRDISLSLLGAEGMLIGADARENGRIQRAGLSSFAPSLGGGTNEIQRNIIGERSLGLPRDPFDDNETPFKELRRS